MTAMPDDDELDVAAMSSQDLLEEAARLRAVAAERRADARKLRSEAGWESREGDQREHEAKLLQEAAAALTALQEASGEIPGLEAAAEGALAAQRLAEDRLRAAEQNLTRRQAEEKSLRDDDHVDPALLDDAAVRTRRASMTADEARVPAADAATAVMDADRRLREKRLEAGRLEAAWKTAARNAQHPGQAAAGVLTAKDMTDDERQALTLGVLLYASRDKPAPARPSPGEVLQDSTRFRAIRGPGSMVVILPAAPSGGRP